MQSPQRRGGECTVQQRLDPVRAAKSSGGIVGFRSVVIQENGVEPAITKKGAAEFSDRRRPFHPAGGFGIELTEFLQVSIFFFGQNFDAHSSRHIDRAIGGFGFFPCVQRFTVIAETSAAFRTFRGAITKNEFARLFVTANYVRLATRSFHFREGPQFFRAGFELCLDFQPFQTFMAVAVFFEASL